MGSAIRTSMVCMPRNESRTSKTNINDTCKEVCVSYGRCFWCKKLQSVINLWNILNSSNCNYFQVTIGKRILGICQNLKEKITNVLFSLKLSGEEYGVLKNKHHSIILGKQESHELNQLKIQDGQVSFVLPFLDDKDLKKILRNTSDVGVEVFLSSFENLSVHMATTEVA